MDFSKNIIDDNLLYKLEKLAMIKIPENKREGFKKELSQIVQKMNELQDINTENVEIKYTHATLMREDTIIDSKVRESILSNAPKEKEGFFIVPKIL